MSTSETPAPTTLRPSQRIKTMLDAGKIIGHLPLRGLAPTECTPAEPTLREILIKPELSLQLISTPKKSADPVAIDRFRRHITDLLASPETLDKKMIEKITPLFQACPDEILKLLDRMSTQDSRSALNEIEVVAIIMHESVKDSVKDKDWPDAVNYLGKTFELASKTYREVFIHEPDQSFTKQYGRIVSLIEKTDFGESDQLINNVTEMVSVLQKYPEVIPLAKPIIDKVQANLTQKQAATLHYLLEK